VRSPSNRQRPESLERVTVEELNLSAAACRDDHDGP
jgi:hypothetical protein